MSGIFLQMKGFIAYKLINDANQTARRQPNFVTLNFFNSSSGFCVKTLNFRHSEHRVIIMILIISNTILPSQNAA